METFAIRMYWPTGHHALLTSGNHRGKDTTGAFQFPAARFYGRTDADEAARRFGVHNPRQRYEVESYPENPYDTGIKDPEVAR